MKPLDDFSPDSRNSTKRASRCKPCNVQAMKEYRARRGEEYAANRRAWIEENRRRIRETQVARHRRIKAEVMRAYGGHCACCGEADIAFLAIDHIDGRGAEHRRSGAGSGRKFYDWLRRNDFPDGFQVLCFNCNFAKANGGCPHQKGVLSL